jgi:aspartyl-tRNA(Asn)/glutamyl-tRNA(Gln) amidotransferase subunit C
MQIDKESLQKIAHLARLEMPQNREDEMLKSLNSVLTWMEQLNEIDTAQVEPLTHMTTELNVFREDAVKHQISRSEALSNAPKADDEYFRVPKVIE